MNHKEFQSQEDSQQIDKYIMLSFMTTWMDSHEAMVVRAQIDPTWSRQVNCVFEGQGRFQGLKTWFSPAMTTIYVMRRNMPGEKACWEVLR